MSLPAAPLILLIPLPNSHDLSVVRFGMALFYGVFAALGGFWLYFFNTRSVKVQFRAEAAGTGIRGRGFVFGSANPRAHDPSRGSTA